MSYFRVEKITKGLIWVEVEEADLRLCCGCPPDTTKFLKGRGLLDPQQGLGKGPNALLISDSKVQRGRMVSFAEFPVMQMLYIQGMIANAGKDEGLPLIMGLKENVNVQLAYLGRGNYGYYSKNELLESGCTAEEADLYYKTKLWFAEGRIYRPKELCKTLYLDGNAHEVRKGVYIRRTGYNLFQVHYKNEKVVIDLNESNEGRLLPFHVKDCEFEFTDFSVVHNGEGNGWEPEYPCMGSLVINKGKMYAVDTGPGFLDVVNHLGVDVQDLEGIFLTHVHDDHFAGLPDLLQSTKRLKFFSTSLVRHTAQMKLTALMDVEREAFHHFFDVHDLTFDVWNQVEGMEVLPFFSPHPVETNAFLFRRGDQDGYKTYAHFADTISFKNLDKIEQISRSSLSSLKTRLLESADVKKVDVGGGFIHGEKEDYEFDKSPKIVLSHNKSPSYRLNGREYSGSQFGHQDVLIKGDILWCQKEIFRSILQRNFPDLRDTDCMRLFDRGELRRVWRGDSVDLGSDFLLAVLNGSISYSNVSFKERIVFGRYHLLGLEDVFGGKSTGYEVSSSFANVLRFPRVEFMAMLKAMPFWNWYSKKKDLIRKLSQSRIFDHYSCSDLIFILAQHAEILYRNNESTMKPEELKDLYVLSEGRAYYWSQEKKVMVKSGEFFGGNFLFSNDYGKYDILFTENSELIKVPGKVIENMPLVLWKIYENCTTLSHICKTR